MTTYGVIGHTGKIGSLLVQRANFVPVQVDVTNLDKLSSKDFRGLDILVNCAAVSNTGECEKNYQRAIDVNFKGAQNIHDLFGRRVLYLSTEQVFGNQGWFLPKESSDPYPINGYGMTKLAGEGATLNSGGKVIRLSRTVAMNDDDISKHVGDLYAGRNIEVPDFFYRNYIYRDFAVDGIEYFVKNFEKMPPIVHYASRDNISYYDLIRMLAKRLGLGSKNISRRKSYYTTPARPKKSGLDVGLARKLGFPMYEIGDTIDKLAESING